MIEVTVALVSYLVFMATTKLLRFSVRWLNITIMEPDVLILYLSDLIDYNKYLIYDKKTYFKNFIDVFC